MKSAAGGSAGLAGEEADGEVERPPPRVDGRGTAAVGRPERAEDECSLSRRREIGLDLGRLIRRVLLVLVERRRPGRLLRRGVDHNWTTKPSNGGQHPERDLRHRSVRSERHPLDAPVRVLDRRLMEPQVQCDHDRSRPVARGQRQRLPAACGQAKCGVLELRLRRRQCGGQLAQHLGMPMKRLAGRRPRLVRKGGPTGRHARTLPFERYQDATGSTRFAWALGFAVDERRGLPRLLVWSQPALQAPSVPATPGSLSSVSASAVISLSSRCSSKSAVIDATWAQEAAWSRRAPGLGQAGVGDAEIGRAGFTLDEPFGLEPFEQPRDARRGQKQLAGDVDALQPLTVGVGEDEQGFVVVDREAVLLEQLGAQQPGGAGGGTQQAGEGANGGFRRPALLAAVWACGMRFACRASSREYLRSQ